MNYSVTITNNCGATQSVAIVLADSSNNGGFPLICLCSDIPDGVSHLFDCGNSNYGLGWGTTLEPIKHGVSYVNQQCNAADPDGNNAIAITYVRNAYADGSFTAGTAYHDGGLDDGQLAIVTDSSFTVQQAEQTAVALYVETNVETIPAIAMPATPNTHFYFDVGNLTYYMLVTSAPAGVALSETMLLNQADSSREAISVSSPTPISFGPGSTDLFFELSATLTFIPCSPPTA